MKSLSFLLAFTFCVLSINVSSGHAEEQTQAAPIRNQDLSLMAATINPVDDLWRSNLPRDPEQATNLYMSRISPTAKARSDSYFEGGYWLSLWNALRVLLVALILLSSGVSLRLRKWTQRKSKSNAIQFVLYSLCFFAITNLIDLPLRIYEDFLREHQYGLSNLTFLAWSKEDFIKTLIELIMGTLGVSVLYSIIRKLPKTWPIWGAIFTISLVTFGTFIAPVYIAPLFNTYSPLEAGPTKEAILSLARANGVPAQDVYRFDASKQSDRVSANVSGIFGTTVISLNDNLLKRTTLPEIKAVLGHEMGHYVLNHNYKMLTAFTLEILAVFWFVIGIFGMIQAHFGLKWGIEGISDIAGLPLFLRLFNTILFILSPINNTLIRTQEAEADAFGVNASREPDGMAEVNLKLTEYRKSDPGPVEELLFFDHPSPRRRIFATMRWKAENSLPRN